MESAPFGQRGLKFLHFLRLGWSEIALFAEGADTAAAQGFEVKIVTLPRGQDPADAPAGDVTGDGAPDAIRWAPRTD